MNKIWLGLLCFVLPIYIFNSCKKGADNFTVGQELVNVNSNIVVNDTATIHCYTVRSDSIITSGTGQAMVGYYTDADNNLGSITATSYMQIGLPSSFTIYPLATCDSVVLFLHSNKYSYGDTTLPYTIVVRQLTQSLDSNVNVSGYRYNISTPVKYDTVSEPLGQKTFLPRPGSSADITITLTPATQAKLFDLIMNKVLNQDAPATKLSTFLSNFKGIALIPDKSNNSILTFQATADQNPTLFLRFYIHTPAHDQDLDTHSTLDFAMINTALQFNHITNTGLLNHLKSTDKFPSALSGNVTYCQAGTGFMTKFEIPYIRNFQLSEERIKILRAEMLIYPEKNTYTNIPLPPKLTLYLTNDINELKGIVIDTTKNQMYTDNYSGGAISYIIDVTSYVNSLFQNPTSEVPALMASFLYADNSTKLKRVILSDGLKNLNSTRLRITYWRY